MGTNTARQDAIRGAYRMTGSSSFYDGMITCTTLYVPQRRPTQDDRQDHRSHAGYGRGYVDAGPADPFQAETYDGF